MGKSTINGQCSIARLVYHRVFPYHIRIVAMVICPLIQLAIADDHPPGGDRLPEAHALLGECRYRAARDANSSSALVTKTGSMVTWLRPQQWWH